MTEAEILRVESALGYALPKHYRQFILQHGDELQRINIAIPLRVLPYSDPDEMIRDNEFSRTGDIFRIGEEQHPWPDSHFLIATNGAGDYWYVY